MAGECSHHTYSKPGRVWVAKELPCMKRDQGGSARVSRASARCSSQQTSKLCLMTLSRTNTLQTFKYVLSWVSKVLLLQVVLPGMLNARAVTPATAYTTQPRRLKP